MAHYIVAPKRGTGPAKTGCDWHALLDPIPGLRVQGCNSRRAMIEASEDAVLEARRKLGPDFRFELSIEHKTFSAA